MGNGCFNYQTTSVISVNSVHSVQKTQLKCVSCMQVLQQHLYGQKKMVVHFRLIRNILLYYNRPEIISLLFRQTQNTTSCELFV